jgi:hypothetical protein
MITKVHGLIPFAEEGPCNFLTLVCLGHRTGWAASFDFNLDVEWYEHVEDYPFAARHPSPTGAILLAGAMVLAYLGIREEEIP